jgi:hypothetical protein
MRTKSIKAGNTISYKEHTQVSAILKVTRTQWVDVFLRCLLAQNYLKYSKTTKHKKCHKQNTEQKTRAGKI